MFTLKSFILPFLLSFFIYMEYIELTNYFINTVIGLFSIYLLLVVNKKELFFVGTVVGILWFWWLGYSFVYYDLLYLIPIIIFGVAFLYGILFYCLGLVNNLIYKVIYLFLLTFIEPFSFNWFKIELLFINSYLGTSKYEFLALLFTTALLVYLKSMNKFKLTYFQYIFVVGVLVFINYNKPNSINNNNLKIYLQETHLDQDKKWNVIYRDNIISKNIENIDLAIKNHYDMIIFPETSYPLILNHNTEIYNLLLSKSNDISIVLGSLFQKDGMYYNSTYFFNRRKVSVAHKVVLVPFGEAVPLPAKIRDLINDMFYDGAKDYETAKSPTTFEIEGMKFRNAICYEATTDKIYENLDTKYVISISNNAWFVPSIQPTLQRLLLKYYAKKYGLIIYNVTNKSKSGIIQ